VDEIEDETRVVVVKIGVRVLERAADVRGIDGGLLGFRSPDGGAVSAGA